MNTTTATQTPTLTGADLVFARRMLPHFMAGKTPAEAAAAVLEDDARIFTASCDDSHQFQGFNGTSHAITNNVAKTINRELSDRVYAALNAA